MQPGRWSAAIQEQHHSCATKRLHKGYKRRVLATTPSIFDTLGLLSPAVIVYKIFLQKLWLDKLQWDKFLPAHLQQEWNQLQQTIPQLQHIKINRKVIYSNATNIQLYGFCDSCERTYETCLYIRYTDSKRRHLMKFYVPPLMCHHWNN